MIPQSYIKVSRDWHTQAVVCGVDNLFLLLPRCRKGNKRTALLSPGYWSYRGYRALSGHYRVTIGPLSTIGSDSGSAAIGGIGHYRGTIGPFQIARMIRHYRTLSGTIGLSGYRVPLSNRACL